MIEVVALLISLNADVLILTELEKFSKTEDCADFAKMERRVVQESGHVGIGCGTYENGTLEVKIFGRLRK